ncbi:hypothetical protein XCV0406 [Xanthomonas euvesicatoria pv. vesicatoria str. 85-10]|uniref:Uncharacterized protein n=1 Tax=Xanthomonas euvesicatoria pv. vesicatoria (strain 85-10) TaxID=316273 RepID=Q3BYM6_XANE5|nr:hypothetical protein XCV0406 [Xanthomonas euvesicatoria pv. vesicatoria str. 85-10]
MQRHRPLGPGSRRATPDAQVQAHRVQTCSGVAISSGRRQRQPAQRPHLTVSLGTRLSAVTAEPAWQPHHLPQPTRANARPWPLATLIAAASRTP